MLTCVSITKCSIADNYFLLENFRLVTKLGPFPGMKHLDVAGGTGRLMMLRTRMPSTITLRNDKHIFYQSQPTKKS